MITTGNYFSGQGDFNPDELPEKLQKGHNYLVQFTKKGKSWNFYNQSHSIKLAVDTYLEQLNSYLATEDTQPPAQKPDQKQTLPKAKKTVMVTPRGKRYDFVGWNFKDEELWEDADKIRYIEEGVFMAGESFSLMPGKNGKIGPKPDAEKAKRYQLATPYKPSNTKKAPTTKKRTTAKPKAKAATKPKTKNQATGKRTSAKPKPRPAKAPKIMPDLVRDLDVEYRLISRFVNTHKKPKTYKQVLMLFHAVNKAIEKGHVRKTKNPTPYHAEIEYIQGRLLHVLQKEYSGKDENEIRSFEWAADKFANLKKVKDSFSIYPSVRFALRFIGMEGKAPETIKARKLAQDIEKALGNGKIKTADPNLSFVKKMSKSLMDFANQKTKVVTLHKQTLQGLCGIVASCSCIDKLEDTGTGDDSVVDQTYVPGLGFVLPESVPDSAASRGTPERYDAAYASTSLRNGESQNHHQTANGPKQGYLIPPPKGRAVSFSSDKLPAAHDKTYDFTGRWGQLFNSPVVGFSAMIYGKPKSGKSTMAMDLGGYLARNHGRVLYASIEEGARGTITERIKRLDVAHPDMEVKNYLPMDLTGFDFVITDSVSRGNVDINMMRDMIEQWPQTSFLFIFHTTKDGLPRGTQEYLHEVDVLVKVDQGEATADGRFGPGEMLVRFE